MLLKQDTAVRYTNEKGKRVYLMALMFDCTVVSMA
jgi:hypothetical protein